VQYCFCDWQLINNKKEGKQLQFIAILLLLGLQSTSPNLVTLDELRWKNRIIITITNDHKINKTVFEQISEKEEQVMDRDLVCFLISPDKVMSNGNKMLSLEDQGNLIQKYYKNTDQLKVLLIGKDGGVKMTSDSFDLDEIFRLIDSMPMRQQEMKNKK
jgi:hypothetical protein